MLVGTRLIDSGRTEFGRQLIARGHVHDASKFHGIEWQFLHVGPNVDPDNLALAIRQHQLTNSHHPEYHGGFCNMPPLDIAEMLCDCYARSQERGTDIREWFVRVAIEKYQIDTTWKQWDLLQRWLNVLLRSSFK